MQPTIDTANALSISDFHTRFLPDLPAALPPSPSTPSPSYNLTLESSSTITIADLQSCYELIKATSYDDYKASSKGWSRSRKMEEMKLPDLRYLLIKKTALTEANLTKKYASEDLMGFLSFMLTYEDGYEVIYCYEVHLQSELRGIGAGKSLMGIMEMVGRRAEVAKAMLTVFVENKGALKFYEKLGYERDEFSPAPRRLRNGVIKNPTYLILSKSLP